MRETPSTDPAPLALIVDDDRGFALGLTRLVAAEGFEVTAAHSLAEARAQIALRRPDIVLADLLLPDGSGADLLDGLEHGRMPELVLITAHASVETAVDVLRRGAVDYLTKPVDFARVKIALAALKRAVELKGEIGTLRGRLRKLGRFGGLVGAAPVMQGVYDLVERVAASDARVLISGETGTGKEVVAQAIHSLSRRRANRFEAVNCGAIPANLIESALFGHERGSFTGADRQHQGHFERAHGGTLFLDEITEMPTELQVRLLRVLESSAITRVGGSTTLPIDVRVIAATNYPIAEAVPAGKLREDLLYRLNVISIALPPLRDRGDDVVLIAEHFLSEQDAAAGTQRRFSTQALARLRAHRWPGNVRELKNVIERSYILSDGDLDVDLAPSADAAGAASGVRTPIGSSLADSERLLILATLEHAGGDKKKAASILKVGLNTLYNRLREYKVD
jgi:two-component system, NtrC family, response regulator AtoC